MIIIAKETPHLFIWFSDGSKIPDGLSPLPQNARFDYVKRLREECAKLLWTQTPAYLVYMGRLLSAEQKALLEDLQNESPNLAVIDYDEVEQNISEEQIIHKVAQTANAYKKYGLIGVGDGGIADLVDFTRLVLIYHSKTLRDIAQKKIALPLKWREGLIYRDFDVALDKESMPDIPTTNGYMATLNFTGMMHAHYYDLIESAKDNEELTQKITLFFNTHIYNLERYKQIIALFINPELTEQEEKTKLDLLLEYDEICIEDNFKLKFISLILIENSFLAINKDLHPLIGAAINEACGGSSPYAVVQKYFRKEFRQKSYIPEYLTPQILGFNIGNDCTWKIDVRQQHLLHCPIVSPLRVDGYDLPFELESPMDSPPTEDGYIPPLELESSMASLPQIAAITGEASYSIRRPHSFFNIGENHDGRSGLDIEVEDVDTYLTIGG